MAIYPIVIQMNRPNGTYNISLLDDLHTYYPAILYEPERFTSLASILQYVQTQNRYHFDIFSRNQQNYIASNPRQTPMVTPLRHPPQGPPPVRRRPIDIPQPTQFITETYDFTPLFTTDDHLLDYPIQQQMRSSSSNSMTLLTELLNIFQLPQRGGPAAAANLDPVLVYPSIEQLEASTSLRAATVADEQEIQTCSICQEGYVDGQAIRTINHCHHAFHKTCIDPWFQRNVRCPVCRHDIREQSNSSQNGSS